MLEVWSSALGVWCLLLMMSDSVCAVESRFPMKPRIWLSFDGRPWQELADDDNGTIAVSRIAARTRLRPDSLTVGDDSLGIFEGITIQDIRSVLGSTAGTARECAVPVDGDALQPGPAGLFTFVSLCAVFLNLDGVLAHFGVLLDCLFVYCVHTDVRGCILGAGDR